MLTVAAVTDAIPQFNYTWNLIATPIIVGIALLYITRMMAKRDKVHQHEANELSRLLAEKERTKETELSAWRLRYENMTTETRLMIQAGFAERARVTETQKREYEQAFSKMIEKMDHVVSSVNEMKVDLAKKVNVSDYMEGQAEMWKVIRNGDKRK